MARRYCACLSRLRVYMDKVVSRYAYCEVRDGATC